MNQLGIFDRTSDKLMYLPAFTLAFMSLHQSDSYLYMVLSSFELGFVHAIILYLVSSTANLVLLEDMMKWTSEELRDSDKLLEYFLKDFKGVLRLLILIISLVFTGFIYLLTTYRLFNLVPGLDESITTISIGYTLLIGQLVFLIDLHLGILLSRAHTEEVADFKEKYYELRGK